MSTCENCEVDLPEDTLHTISECFANLNAKIEKLEDENRGLREANEAYKRQIRKACRAREIAEAALQR